MTTSLSDIAEHPFLRGLRPDHLKLVGPNRIQKTFDPGQILIREGEPASEFFLIESGKVSLESCTSPGRTVQIQVIGPGEVLGWSWLFPPFSWHFKARVLERTTAIGLDGAHLLVTAEADHAFGYELQKRVSRIVIQRLHAARKQLVEESRKTSAGLVLEPPVPTVGDAREINDSLSVRMARHPFLRSMAPEHLRVLADSSMSVKFEPGQSIFAEGEKANRFYLIEQGEVVLESTVAERDSVPIQILADGDVLGWSWLYPPYRWHCDARAIEATKTLFFYGAGLREQCEEDSDLGYDLMKRVTQVVIQRLQSTRRRLIEIKARS